MDTKIKNGIDEIIKFTDKLPQKYQTDAFKTLLKHFLINSTIPQHVSNVEKKSTTIPKKLNTHNMNTILSSDCDWSKLNLDNIDGLQLYLSILDIVRIDLNINSLSTLDIHNILKEKYRIDRSVNAIGMALLNVQGKYVTRIRSGSSYKHKITSLGIKHIYGFKKHGLDVKI